MKSLWVFCVAVLFVISCAQKESTIEESAITDTSTEPTLSTGIDDTTSQITEPAPVKPKKVTKPKKKKTKK